MGRVDLTPYPGSGTNTAAALLMAMVDQFNVINGDRPAVTNVAVVITDAVSNVDNANTIPTAEAAIAQGIYIMAVGIGPDVSENELSGISSSPQTLGSSYWMIPDFPYFSTYAGILANAILSFDYTLSGMRITLYP